MIRQASDPFGGAYGRVRRVAQELHHDAEKLIPAEGEEGLRRSS